MLTQEALCKIDVAHGLACTGHEDPALQKDPHKIEMDTRQKIVVLQLPSYYKTKNWSREITKA